MTAAGPAGLTAGQTPGRGVAAAGSDRYLTFQLGGELYALPILEVTEILEYRQLTVVPLMPPFIRGIINLRGRAVPVVDLVNRFGQGSTEVARRTGIVIVDIGSDGDAAGPGHGQARHVGVLVDGVNKVMHLSEEDIEPAPSFGSGTTADVVGGMARYDGRFIVVLALRRVLSLDQFAAVEQALTAGDAVTA